jgi:hypothetical protein
MEWFRFFQNDQIRKLYTQYITHTSAKKAIGYGLSGIRLILAGANLVPAKIYQLLG